MMIKKFLCLSFVCGLMLACAPSKYIEVFENKFLSALSSGEYQNRREHTFAKCRLEVLKISVPAPTCTPVTQCDDEGNNCRVSNYCDDWATDRALSEREEAQLLCMKIAGWRVVRKLNPEWVEWQKVR